jgi:hypothetical protein
MSSEHIVQIECKLIDFVIICKQSDSLKTSELQFGYKTKLSTGIATSVVLQTVDYYTSQGANVYALALDATKAFDRVKYDTLFELLLKRDINPVYIRLLMKMYIDQKLRVCYNRQSSAWFNVTNGVKQGGVLSPTLFCLYMDGLLQELEKSGVGCYVGHKFVGSIGYADDLLILTPTLHALRVMIHKCEKYALDYDIKFNGSKSQLMVYGDNNIDTDVYVFGDKVNIVTEMKYLGYKLSNDVSDSMIKPVINDFVSKFNSFTAYFDKIRCDVKNVLFKQYCTSFYGYQNCALYDNDMELINIAMRKAIRRLWQLPYRTHCSLLSHISDLPPCDVIFQKRFMSHFMLGYHNNNSIVQNIFKGSLFGHSRLSRNYRYVVNLIKDSQGECSNILSHSHGSVKSLINNVWFSKCLSEDIRKAIQIKELCLDRDDLSDGFLERQEINDILQYLCTD